MDGDQTRPHFSTSTNGDTPPSPSTQPRLPAWDISDGTRKTCLVVVQFSTLLSLGTVGVCGSLLRNNLHNGLVSILPGLHAISPGDPWARVLPFIFILLGSVIAESLSYIHAVSLRWALLREGQLEYNSHYRLFTSARTTFVNSWPVNVLSGTCLTVSYAAGNQIFTTEWDALGSQQVGVNSMAVLMLGLALFGLSMISLACLQQCPNVVLSWSRNPINTALICAHTGLVERRAGRGLMPVHDCMVPAQLSVPLTEQRALWEAPRAMQNVVRITYVFFVCCLVVAVAFTFRGPTTWAFFPGRGNSSLIELSKGSMPGQVVLFGVVILSATIQAPLVMVLHCAELVVDTWRDEAVWRAAYSKGGAVRCSNALLSALSSWEWTLLLLFKAAAHWLLGSAAITVAVDQEATMLFTPLPLFVLAGAMLCLVVFEEHLLRRRPQGPQPASFGHVQTLVDLIDDWGGEQRNGRLWWGMKGCETTEIAVAGTSGRREEVREIDTNYRYV